MLPGLQSKVEARNVNFPCKNVADCGDPAKCECKMNLCFCHPAEQEKEMFTTASVKQNQTPLN